MEFDNLKRNLSIAASIIFLGFLIILILSIFRSPDVNCACEEDLKKRSFNGIVLNKYKDYNQHAYPAIKISSGNLYSKEYFFEGENSGCYNFVQIGDSLVKEKGSLVINLIRNGIDTFFIIDYGCEK